MDQRLFQHYFHAGHDSNFYDGGRFRSFDVQHTPEATIRRVINSTLQVNGIELGRLDNSVKVNDDWLHLTKSNMETLSVFLKATLDGDFLSGLDVETWVSG